MKIFGLLWFIFLIGISTQSWSQEKTNSAQGNDTMLDKCSKILTYGMPMDFYKPSKGDAVIALGLLGDEKAVPVLIDHLENEENSNLRMQITKALGWIGSTNAVPALEKALQDEYPFTRKTAALALRKITGKDYEYDTTGILNPTALFPRTSEDLQRVQLEVNAARKKLGLRDAVLTDSASISLASLALQWLKAMAELKKIDANLKRFEAMEPAERVAAYYPDRTNLTNVSEDRIENMAKGILTTEKANRELRKAMLAQLEKMIGEMNPEKFDEKGLIDLKQLESKLELGAIDAAMKQQMTTSRHSVPGKTNETKVFDNTRPTGDDNQK